MRPLFGEPLRSLLIFSRARAWYSSFFSKANFVEADFFRDFWWFFDFFPKKIIDMFLTYLYIALINSWPFIYKKFLFCRFKTSAKRTSFRRLFLYLPGYSCKLSNLTSYSKYPFDQNTSVDLLCNRLERTVDLWAASAPIELLRQRGTLTAD